MINSGPLCPELWWFRRLFPPVLTTAIRLQAVQNAAAKLLTKCFKMSHQSWFLYTGFHEKFRIQFNILVITFGALHGQAPAYIKGLLQSCITCRNMRSSDQGLLVVPRSRLKIKGDFWRLQLSHWTSLKSSMKPVCLDLLVFSLVFLAGCLHLMSIALICFFLSFIVKHFVTSALERCYINKLTLHYNILNTIFSGDVLCPTAKINSSPGEKKLGKSGFSNPLQ